MKITLLMTVSIDGYIAYKNGEVPWPKEEFDRCNAFAKQAGNIIVGRKTFDLMQEAGDFDSSVITVVLSKAASKDFNKVHFVSSIEDALGYLETQNVKNAIVGGGCTVNTAFLEAGLYDEIILDVEPIVIGEGIPLFKKQINPNKWQLLKMAKLSDNEIRIHYKSIK